MVLRIRKLKLLSSVPRQEKESLEAVNLAKKLETFII
ncbi:hypothetical protein BACI348_40977 [Bacillus altitudinis]|uniref:Uncharacterized protein n=1 Tax=Bacillus altitudinis TaxID=293387 RepID=A0A653RGW5_BACAB|nr:hypothetical protein BACI348_40977 [Bacillus altitudinis]